MNLIIKIPDVTPKQLFFACAAIDFEFKNPTSIDQTKYLLSYYSILTDVRLKLQKKFITNKDKMKLSLSLKYHEAKAFHETLKVLGYDSEVQPLFDKLDQKLA